MILMRQEKPALGWLNASANLRAVDRIDWNVFVMELLITFRDSLRAHSAEIAHLKIHLAAGNNRLEGNITSNESEPSVRGKLETWQLEPILLINARVHIDPDDCERSSKKVCVLRRETT